MKIKIIRLISRILVGLVFIFSGFVKAVDPLGYTYKFNDYFDAFHVGFFSGISLPLAIFFSSLEFIIGFALLLDIRLKFFSWVLLILMSYFFILTLIIAITNPVTDCGCFGDFLIISNWETFYKNIVLLGLSIIIFLGKNKFTPIYKPAIEWTIISCFFIFILWVSIYCINHLPFLDFRPYHIGANIPAKMEIPDGAPVDEYETTLVYEKNGVQKEFSVNDPEWQDGTWTWVETKQVLIKKGYVPPIHDFIITSNEGIDITWDILDDRGYSFLLISDKIDISKKKYYIEADKLALFCDQQPNFSFYAITSSTNDEIEMLKQETNISYDFYTADNITLKTIIRSKPGLILIKEGNVIGKWHYNDFPEINDINEFYFASLMNNQRKKNEKYITLIIGLFIVISIYAGKFAIKLYNRD